jgi:hypothetical protein
MSTPLESPSGEPLAKVSVEATQEPDLALSRFQLLPGEIRNMIYGFICKDLRLQIRQSRNVTDGHQGGQSGEVEAGENSSKRLAGSSLQPSRFGGRPITKTGLGLEMVYSLVSYCRFRAIVVDVNSMNQERYEHSIYRRNASNYCQR